MAKRIRLLRAINLVTGADGIPPGYFSEGTTFEGVSDERAALMKASGEAIILVTKPTGLPSELKGGNK